MGQQLSILFDTCLKIHVLQNVWQQPSCELLSNSKQIGHSVFSIFANFVTRIELRVNIRVFPYLKNPVFSTTSHQIWHTS